MTATHPEMWALAATFPTLSQWAARHAGKDFDGDFILAALREPWVTSGSRYALLFVADVWNSSGMRPLLPRTLRQWSIADALAVWDAQHREAALVWMSRPWWP
jgi:hypothetical protein